MIQLTIQDQSGKKTSTVEVNEAIFGVDRNDSLISQVYHVLVANRMSGHSHAKDRSERAGSGRKPWKQKGTGRARTGSVRNPIWRKGGVIFGPNKEQSQKGNIPVKMRRRALAVALSDKIRDEKIRIVNSWTLEEVKTSQASKILEALEVNKDVCVVLDAQESASKRAFFNIPRVSVAYAQDLNVVDVLHSQVLVVSEVALSAIEKRLA